MKLIWVLLLLTATVAFVRADEEEQELVDVEDTEIEEITEDELEAEDLEDPRKQHRKGRRPFPLCRLAARKRCRSLKDRKKNVKCRKVVFHRCAAHRFCRRVALISCAKERTKGKRNAMVCIKGRVRRCLHKVCKRRVRKICLKRGKRGCIIHAGRICRKLRHCGGRAKRCFKKANKRRNICRKVFKKCMKKGGKPRDEFLEDQQDEELAEMPEELSVAEGIEEDEEQMDPGRKAKRCSRKARRICMRRTKNIKKKPRRMRVLRKCIKRVMRHCIKKRN